MKKNCHGMFSYVPFILMIFMMMAVLTTGCTKTDLVDAAISEDTDKIPPTIVSVDPENNVNTVSLTAKATVIFSEKINEETLDSASFKVKKGNTGLPGTISYSGKIATFTPTAPFEAETKYTCIINNTVKDVAGNALAASHTWSFTTVGTGDTKAPAVLSVSPSANATSVATSTNPSVTFSEPMNASTINSSSFTLKKGSTVLPGTVSVSGNTATLDPAATLESATIYTCTVNTSVKDAAGNALAANYSWSFTTTALADTQAPIVISVLPAANATSVATSTNPSVTFSEAMNAATINSNSFTIKKGSTVLPGTVSISGNTATLDPAATLESGTIYTCTVTTSVKDAAGNALAANYSWSFTTTALADTQAPIVISVLPAANATSVATSTNPSVTFSEAMNAATINSNSFTIKKGSTALAGSVSVSGNTATLNPTATLESGTVYTCTVTTSVKDAAGNALAANYTWSFTTVAATTSPKSFAADVVPILNKCNTCHKHNWTPSPTPSVFHANLVSSGHINLTTPTSGKIYNKVNGGHPSSTVTSAEKTILLTWIKEGSKNN